MEDYLYMYYRNWLKLPSINLSFSICLNNSNIPYELFQKAQEVRLGHNKNPFQYAAKPFLFRGMITCADCGCLVSPEIKKEKYVLKLMKNGNC